MAKNIRCDILGLPKKNNFYIDHFVEVVVIKAQ